MNITPKAIAKVQEMASKQNLTNYGLRIMVVGGGCSGFSYNLDFDDTKQPNDFVLEEEGLKIFVDPMSFQYLDGTKIDYVESFMDAGFQFENPNATTTCGCGSSFAM
jgi:iron-sulfur cluster insertion protein